MGAKVTCKGRDLSESFGISSAAFYFDGKKTHCARIQGFVHAVYAKWQIIVRRELRTT